MTALLAYAASVLGTFAVIALLVWLLMLAIERLTKAIERTEWTEQPTHIRLVSSSPEGCRLCGLAGMHTPDCWRRDGAA